ncbi:MAG TPA: hypothetical protein VF219_21250 [Vicinamibacterales bacterium]
MQVPAVERRADTPKDVATGETLEEVEGAHILAALKETRWILAGPRTGLGSTGARSSSA